MKEQMKKKLERLEVEILLFTAEDIITTSGGENEGPFVPFSE